jgi:tetratricopeptide (TPR) repeat protein
VESVAWVAERKDVLSTLFWMLTLEAYVAWVRDPKPRRYALVLLAFAAGLMSKPMLVTLPFALLLLDVWPLRRMTDAASARRLVVEKVPLFALAAASSVVTFLVQRAEGAVADFATRPLAERLVNAPIAYVAYVRKMLAPTDLAAMYAQARPFPAWMGAAAAAALALVTWIAWRQARTRPWFVVGWLWFVGTLVPVIGLVQVGMQTMADRYTYVPLIGLFFFVAWGAAELLDAERRRGAAAVLASAAVVACAVLARRQVDVWRDGETLWRHAVAVDPDNPAARNFLGSQMCFLERYDEAATQFREMIRLTPDSATAHNNLGYALRSRGDLEGAVVEFRQALRMKPDLAEARDDLRLVLTQLGRVDEARAIGR